MEHYFTDNRHLKENRKEITFRFWCFDYSFITDNGVFSKEAIDYGTQVLLKTICEREELGERIFWIWAVDMDRLGLFLKKIYPTKAFEMIDVNPRADVQLAKENICRNQLEADVHVSNIYVGSTSRKLLLILLPIRRFVPERRLFTQCLKKHLFSIWNLEVSFGLLFVNNKEHQVL